MSSVPPNTLASYLDAAKAAPSKNRQPTSPEQETTSKIASSVLSSSNQTPEGIFLRTETQRAVMGNLTRITNLAEAVRQNEVKEIAEQTKKLIIGEKIEGLTNPKKSSHAAKSAAENLPRELKEPALKGDMAGVMQQFSKMTNTARLNFLSDLIAFFDQNESLGCYSEEDEAHVKREIPTLPALLSQIDHKKTTKEEIEKVEMAVFEGLKRLPLERALSGLDGMLLHSADAVKKSWKTLLVVLKEEGGEPKIRSALNHNIELYKLAHEMASKGVKLAQELKQEIQGTKASPLCAVLKKDYATSCRVSESVIEDKMSRERGRVLDLETRFDNLLKDLKKVEEHLRAVEAHLAISITTLSRREELVQNTLWGEAKIDELYWSGKFAVIKKSFESLNKIEEFAPYKDFVPSSQEVNSIAATLCVSTKKCRIEHENNIKNGKMDEGVKKRTKEQLKSNFELYNVLVGQAEKIKRELKQKYNRGLRQQVSPLTHEAIDSLSKQMGLSRALIEQTTAAYGAKFQRRQVSYGEQVKGLRELESRIEDVQHELAIAAQTLREGKAVLMKGTLFGGEKSRIAHWVAEFNTRRTENEKLFSEGEESFLIKTYDAYKEEKIVEEAPKAESAASHQ